MKFYEVFMSEFYLKLNIVYNRMATCYSRDLLLALRGVCPTLSDKVRSVVRRLYCARRGCRAGERVQVRRQLLLKVKPPAEIPVVIGRRVQSHTVLRSDRVTVRTNIRLVNLDASRQQLHLGFLNVRSLGSGTSPVVQQFIVAESFDVFAAVETWHDDVSSPSLLLSCPAGYHCVERARPRTKKNQATIRTNHGGIAVFHKNTMRACKFRLPEVKTMECLGLKFTDGSRYRAVYRPGSQAVTDEFFDELQLVLTSIQSTAHEAVIVGDFNVHVDVSTDSVAQQLNDVLTDNGLSAR